MKAPETGRCADLCSQIAALDAGRVTSADLVERAIRQIHASQPTLHTFRFVREEAARAEAEAADRRRAAGETAPLLGVPIALKDDVDCAGLPTTLGTSCDCEPARADAEMVRRLRAAGAIIVGKTQASELLQWPFSGGPTLGHTHNPWQRGLTAGGSSGGSAAAVAAGLVPAAMGSDGAGSIRIPAAWNNLVGIKPQRGRISTAPEPEMMQGMAVLGPLTRTVRDAALLLDLLSGPHPQDRHRPAPVRTREAIGRDTGRLRIGLCLDMPFTGAPARLDPAVRDATQAVARTLAQIGHDVREDAPRYSRLLVLHFMVRVSAGLEEWRQRLPEPEKLEKRTRQAAGVGRRLNGRPLAVARRSEAWLQEQIGRVFERVDIVLAPTTATPPPPVDAIDHKSSWQTHRIVAAACPYAWPWNIVGWPSVNVPAGFSADGLPLGVQLMGPADSEPLLVAVAAQLEAVLQWHRHAPTPWW